MPQGRAAKHPKAIVDKINADITEAQKSAEVVEHFKKLNVQPVEAKALVAEELKRWSEVVREAGIKPH
jgi:tripartite-type tricarboxylate transporter receptor subunit TctC